MALADIRQDARRLLRDQPVDDGITTAPSPAGTGTTISFTTAALWEIGDTVDIPALGEALLITAGSTNPYTIKRGHRETTAGSITTSHRALKKPRHLTNDIDETVQRVADALYGDGIYEFGSTTITPSTTSVIYDLPSDYREYVAMSQTNSGDIEDLTWYSPPRAEDELLNVPATISSTNKALRVTSWARTDANATLFYKADVTTATTDTSLQRLVSLGAAYLLLRAEAIEKVDREDEFERMTSLAFLLRDIQQDWERAKSSYRSKLYRRASSPVNTRRLVW